jgi:hypothetical protein
MSRRFVGADRHKRFCISTELDAEGKAIKKGGLAITLKRFPILPAA